MKYIYYILFIGIFSAAIAEAQISISIHDTTVEQNQGSLSVPIYVTNFNGIGAISLIISYDKNLLTFTGISNNPSTKTISSDTVNGQIRMGWYDISPLNLGNGILLNLNFSTNTGTSRLDFIQTECEIADTAANVIQVTYQNGNINITPAPVLPAKLSGNVWYDANGNGIKDPGEGNLRYGVTVDLFTGSGIWKKWALTDTAGNYSFDSLAPGNYYVEMFLIGGYNIYKFTTEYAGNDSTINSHIMQKTDTTGLSNIVILGSGQNYSCINGGVVLKTVDAVLGTGISGSGESNQHEYILLQNYPNPFNPSTKIKFGLPDQEKVTLNVYNILGQRVVTLIDGELSAGYHTATFDASRLASGIYIYQLKGIHVNITKKMMLVE